MEATGRSGRIVGSPNTARGGRQSNRQLAQLFPPFEDSALKGLCWDIVLRRKGLDDTVGSLGLAIISLRLR
jgi:hypothetical protein